MGSGDDEWTEERWERLLRNLGGMATRAMGHTGGGMSLEEERQEFREQGAEAFEDRAPGFVQAINRIWAGERSLESLRDAPSLPGGRMSETAADMIARVLTYVDGANVNGSWEWLGDGGKWQPYEPAQSAILEREFQSGASEAEIRGRHHWIIDFKSMRQRNLSNGGKREVRRAGGSAGGGGAVGRAASAPVAPPAAAPPPAGAPRASSEDIAHLVAFTGKPEEQCQMCFEASGGDRERAAAMLFGL